MLLGRWLRVGIAAAILCSCFARSENATASPSHAGPQRVPKVFLPVVSQFINSPIPVYFPTWLPSISRKVYAGTVYPGFTISFVRAAHHTMLSPEYTYTVIGGCEQVGTETQIVACLKRIAASAQRYTPHAGRR